MLPSVSNEEWHAIAAVAVNTMKSMERLHAKQLEVAERMAQGLAVCQLGMEEAVKLLTETDTQCLSLAHAIDAARKARAEWEALK
jgi:hypothetical protein